MARGLQAHGEANVLSIMQINPCFFASAAMASTSHTLRTGLVRVSIYRTLVLGCIAASYEETSVISAIVTSIPNRGNSSVINPYVPP